jgi:hypothetical protein
MCCKDKRKNYCLEKIQAICTQYKGTVSENSELKDEDCLTIEETTQDIYNIIDIIMKVIDLSDIEYKCLDDIEFEDDENPTLKEILDKLIREICLLKESSNNNPVVNPCEIDLSSCGINPSCLDNDPCTGGFSTLPEVLNSIITKLCAIQNKVENLTTDDIETSILFDGNCISVNKGANLTDTLQAFADKICQLESEIVDLKAR